MREREREIQRNLEKEKWREIERGGNKKIVKE